MARGTMSSKIAVLEEVLTGHFEDHHGVLAPAMLEHIDALTAQIEAAGARIEAVIASDGCSQCAGYATLTTADNAR